MKNKKTPPKRMMPGRSNTKELCGLVTRWGILPDCWHIAQALPEPDRTNVLQAWRIAHKSVESRTVLLAACKAVLAEIERTAKTLRAEIVKAG